MSSVNLNSDQLNLLNQNKRKKIEEEEEEEKNEEKEEEGEKMNRVLGTRAILTKELIFLSPDSQTVRRKYVGP